ncbi:MAG TPA: protein phosphatase 2C domain-containing protein [Myxococcota bacterium]|jgi:hypothetical protein|nr:protein phosphatase 2C domain-containing protein [Myxococcota bacterium]
MRSAWLRGPEALELGAIVERCAGRCAVALSLGGATKSYAHTDPNEDGALVVEGEGGVLVAVADGHGGADAAEAALGHLLAEVAPRLVAAETRLAGRWQDVALEALLGVCGAIRARGAQGGRRKSRTTLACAVARPAEGWLFHVSVGDSHVYQRTEDGAFDLACERASDGEVCFLGAADDTAETLREKCLIGAEPLAGTRAIAAVTDGLSERSVGVDDPDLAVEEAARSAAEATPAERPATFARAILEQAMAAHRRQPSGDNVAAAVAWLAA